jgi:hypothetical protein
VEKQRLTVTGFVNPPSKLPKKIEEWPLHVTVIPPVQINHKRLDEFNNIVHSHVNNYQSFRLWPYARENFGPNADIPVCKVDSEGLYSLHNDIIKDVSSTKDGIEPIVNRFELTPQFTGKNYNPHISDKGLECIMPVSEEDINEYIVLKGLYLVLYTNKGKVITQEYPCWERHASKTR